MNKLKLTIGIAVIAVGMMASANERFTREELAYMSATTQIELFKSGVITPSEVLEAQISRVKEFNGGYNLDRRDLKNELDTFNAGKVNAITFDNFAEARELAKAADERYRKGTARRLEGVTVGVKDDCNVKGWRTDMGTLVLKDKPLSEYDDDHVARLRAEGAIFIFQTTVPEFCASCMTWSRLYGVTHNPWNLPYGTGGSSGGSAASLASGFCTLATGSDMGGSIRIPASMCGVYGFKPPMGRVPCCESTYMEHGPLARTFGDMVLMQDILCGPSDNVYNSLRPKLNYPTDYAPIKGAKVAVAYMQDWTPDGCDVDVVRAMDETVKLLGLVGAEVIKVDLGWKAAEILPIYVAGILTDEVYAGAAIYQNNRELVCPYLAAFYDSLGKEGPSAVIAAHDLQSKLHRQLQKEVFGKGCIALIMPNLTTAHIPADIEATPNKLAEVNGKPYKGIDFCLTPVFNLLNAYPIVSMPVAFSRHNVPIGVQLIGNTYDDLTAMRVAAALSKVAPPNFREGRFPSFADLTVKR